MRDNKVTVENEQVPTSDEGRLQSGEDPRDGGEGFDEPLAEELERLRAEVEEERRRTAEEQDRHLRARADFDNFRRRSRQEQEEARRFAVEDLVSNLLPVLDDFERALEAAQASENADALHQGVAMIYNKLTDVLSKAGVEAISAVGQPFDPSQHEAVLSVEADQEHPTNTVVEELRRGYRLNERVIRASMVKVAA